MPWRVTSPARAHPLVASLPPHEGPSPFVGRRLSNRAGADSNQCAHQTRSEGVIEAGWPAQPAGTLAMEAILSIPCKDRPAYDPRTPQVTVQSLTTV